MKRKQIKLYCFIFLVVSANGFAACRKTGEPVTFDVICQKENHALIEIEGYLRLPTATDLPTTQTNNLTSHQLLLVEDSNGTGGFMHVALDSSKTHEPNRMEELPASYTYNDFHIFTDKGTTVSADDRLKITGQVIKEMNLCVLKISKIETP